MTLAAPWPERGAGLPGTGKFLLDIDDHASQQRLTCGRRESLTPAWAQSYAALSQAAQASPSPRLTFSRIKSPNTAKSAEATKRICDSGTYFARRSPSS